MGIVGETGSGKTTLVQHFNGLLKPSGGKVYVEGKDLSQPGISWPALRRRVGLVFQYPEHQLFEASVFDDIAFALRRPETLAREEVEKRARAACLLVGLDPEEFQDRADLLAFRGADDRLVVELLEVAAVRREGVGPAVYQGFLGCDQRAVEIVEDPFEARVQDAEAVREAFR